MAGHLRIVRGVAEGATITVVGDFVVGRGETGEGNLQGDPEISRRHALFRPTADGRVSVEDLGSTNGTFVADQRVEAPTPVSTGTPVRVGQSVLELQR